MNTTRGKYNVLKPVCKHENESMNPWKEATYVSDTLLGTEVKSSHEIYILYVWPGQENQSFSRKM